MLCLYKNVRSRLFFPKKICLNCCQLFSSRGKWQQIVNYFRTKFWSVCPCAKPYPTLFPAVVNMYPAGAIYHLGIKWLTHLTHLLTSWLHDPAFTWSSCTVKGQKLYFFHDTMMGWIIQRVVKYIQLFALGWAQGLRHISYVRYFRIQNPFI